MISNIEAGGKGLWFSVAPLLSDKMVSFVWWQAFPCLMSHFSYPVRKIIWFLSYHHYRCPVQWGSLAVAWCTHVVDCNTDNLVSAIAQYTGKPVELVVDTVSEQSTQEQAVASVAPLVLPPQMEAPKDSGKNVISYKLVHTGFRGNRRLWSFSQVYWKRDLSR